jgi:hypothetical protein
MSLDFTKPGPQILIDQINADNPAAALTVDKVTFGSPMVNQDPDKALYNSAVYVTPVLGQGFTGPYVYKYNRIDLESLFNPGNSSYAVGNAVRLSDLIAQINAALNIALVSPVVADPSAGVQAASGDYLDIVLPQPTAKHPSIDFVLTADPSSLIYQGSAILTLTTAAVDLASVIKVPSTGLTYAAG